MKRLVVLIVSVILVIGACGGTSGEEETEEPGGPTTEVTGEDAGGDTADGSTTGPQTEMNEETTTTSFVFVPADRLGGSATFNVEGTVLTYSMDEIEYSPNEAISDVTLEECSPNFFGIGTFRAIGYPVDESGELLLLENGGIAGIVDLIVPPDDWEARGLDDGEVELTLDSEAAGIDLRIASPEQAAQIAPNAVHSWSRTDIGISGSIVMTDSRSEPFVVEFEAVCE
ncbi:MAG: hypothetical protein WD651_10255 [Acidimicrobiia bacterium]